MMLLMADIDRQMAALPRAQVPNLLAVLAALTAKAQLRWLEGEPEPVSREAEDLLTVPEVAQRLKMSSYRVYELARQGKIQSNKCGKSVRISPAAVSKYLATQGA